jgi:hypothetical protein
MLVAPQKPPFGIDKSYLFGYHPKQVKARPKAEPFSFAFAARHLVSAKSLE